MIFRGKKAFTLIELLLVMLIISILAVMAVEAYIYARYQGFLLLARDRIMESFRENGSEVRKGSLEGSFCKGLKFGVNQKVMILKSSFDGKKCDKFENVSEIDLSKSTYVSSLKVDNVDVSDLFAYYFPPDATLKLFTQNKEVAAAVIEVKLNNKVDWTKKIEIDSRLNLVKSIKE